jgi:pimeloyl-ACP methyl ester carboxylesterase
MDGTGDLFADFIAAAPPGFPVLPLKLPSTGPQTYPALARWALPRLPSAPVLLVAESFSGPLAILLAEQCASVIGVVLCATFVEAPLPGFLAATSAVLFRIPPPLALLRFFMTGKDHSLAVALRKAMTSLDREALAGRIDEALHVDAAAAFSRLSQPILYLRATHDRIVPRACGERVLALKPSARLAEIQGPHLLLQTRPTEAWRHIRLFLEAVCTPEQA